MVVDGAWVFATAYKAINQMYDPGGVVLVAIDITDPARPRASIASSAPADFKARFDAVAVDPLDNPTDLWYLGAISGERRRAHNAKCRHHPRCPRVVWARLLSPRPI